MLSASSLLKPDQQDPFGAGGGDPTALHLPSASGPAGTVPKPSTSPVTGAQTLKPPQPIVQPPPSGGPAKPVTTAQTPGLTPQNSTLLSPGTAPATSLFTGTNLNPQPTNGSPMTPAPVVQPPQPPPATPASPPAAAPAGAWSATKQGGANPGQFIGAHGEYVGDPSNVEQYSRYGYAKLGIQNPIIGKLQADIAAAGFDPYTIASTHASGTLPPALQAEWAAAYNQTPQSAAAAGANNYGGAPVNPATGLAIGQNGQDGSFLNPGGPRTLQNGVLTQNGKVVAVENGTGAFVDPATGELTNAGGAVAAQSSGATKGLPPSVNGVPIVQWMQQQGLVSPGTPDANGVLQPMVGPPGSSTGVAGASGAPPATSPIVQPPGSSSGVSGAQGAPVTGTNGASPDSLSSSLLQKSQDLLNNPSVYDDALFKQQEDLAKNALDEQYKGLKDNLEGDLSSRGLDWSTIAGGKLNDLATEQGRAWQNIMTQMLTDRAQGLAAARGQAFDQANAEQGYNANRDDTAFGRAVQLMQLQQGANAQNVAEQQGWAQLGLGALNSAQQGALLQATGAQNLSSATSDQLAQMAQLAAQFFGKANGGTSSTTPTPMVMPPGSMVNNANQGMMG